MRVAKARKVQLIDRRSTKSRPVTTAKLGARFLMQIAARHAIGRGAPEDVVFVLSNAGGSEQTIPQIEMSVGKSRMTAHDFVRNHSRAAEQVNILALLFTELVAGRDS